MCAGITIYTALKRCQLETDDRVGIISAGGGLGHLGLQCADKMGYKVHGVDAADASLKLPLVRRASTISGGAGNTPGCGELP